MFDFHRIFPGMVERPRWLAEIRAALKRSRVVALVGPRQVGKTTLARQIVPPGSPAYFDLEDPASLARLAEPRRGVVVLDEIQRRPDLFPVLRCSPTAGPSRRDF
jgi:predicted AAA+ superfamily ATPase